MRTIDVLTFDKELSLEDLKNVKYSFEGGTMYVQFDTIYVDNIDFLFKINIIVLKYLYKPKLNGFYENYKDVYKSHNITISDELSKYLTQKLIAHYEEVEKERSNKNA